MDICATKVLGSDVCLSCWCGACTTFSKASKDLWLQRARADLLRSRKEGGGFPVCSRWIGLICCTPGHNNSFGD